MLTLKSFSKVEADDPCMDEYSTVNEFEISGYQYSAQILTPSGEPVSSEMLELMNEMIERVQQESNEIAKLIFKHYKACEEQEYTDPVPAGLKSNELNQYIVERIIIVGDPLDEEPLIEHRLFFDVEWDEEHGIYLELIDDNWEFSDVL
jgi:Domain of unknown function (DUF6985)